VQDVCLGIAQRLLRVEALDQALDLDEEWVGRREIVVQQRVVLVVLNHSHLKNAAI
jgi:hypothetical protein